MNLTGINGCRKGENMKNFEDIINQLCRDFEGMSRIDKYDVRGDFPELSLDHLHLLNQGLSHSEIYRIFKIRLKKQGFQTRLKLVG